MDLQELVITSDLANLPRVLDFVRTRCIAAGLSDDAMFACELATDEACTNVIEHAYGGTGGEIRISCFHHPDRFVVQVHDHGQPFNPADVAAPSLSGALSEREIGGLGLHFMRSLMDEVRFEFDREDGNTLTMVKRIS